MIKLGWKYWVSLGLIVVGLVFIFWGAHIYSTYPGMKELMKSARHAAHVQYIMGAVCLIISWIILKFFIKKRGKKTKI